MVDISIKNFQSIQDINLKIDGFTVVVGQSNIGKSAIRRAIDFALFSNWSKSYVRNGEKDCFVSIKKDNVVLSKTKGKSNTTEINGIVYEKSGSGVSEEFGNFGIKKLETTDDEYNIMISSQLDRLFLSSFSDTEQHKVLNSILETSTYEEALRMVNADINILSKTDRELSASIDQKTEELGSYEKILSILSRIEDSENKIAFITNYETLRSKSSDSLNVMMAITSAMSKFVIIDINQFANLDANKIKSKLKLEKLSSLHGNFISAILVLSAISTKEENTSLLRKNTILGRLINNIVLTEYVESISFMESTKSKINKAEKIMGLFNSTKEINDKKQIISNYLDIGINIYTKKHKSLNLIKQAKNSIENQIILFSFFSEVNKLSNLVENNSTLNNQILEVTAKIELLKESLPKVCETCGQEISNHKDH